MVKKPSHATVPLTVVPARDGSLGPSRTVALIQVDGTLKILPCIVGRSHLHGLCTAWMSVEFEGGGVSVGKGWHVQKAVPLLMVVAE
jgi:hypothetical protein